MIHIYYMRFNTSVSDQKKDLYMQFLSEERQGRVLRRRSSKTALECMQTGLFLRYGLEQLEEKNLYQRVTVRDNGKPYIKNSKVHFNLSHSGDYVILMIADAECGIDLQKQVNDQERLAKRVLHEEEYTHYAAMPDDMCKGELLSWYWSVKEAYLKYTGDGIRYAMSELNMSDFILNGVAVDLQAAEGNMNAGYEMTVEQLGVHMLRFKLEEEYYGAICMKQPLDFNIVKSVTIEDVFSHFI